MVWGADPVPAPGPSQVERDWLQQAARPEPRGGSKGAALPGVFPIEQAIKRGAALAADLRAAGVATQAFEREASQIEAALKEPGAAGRQDLYFRARAAVRALAFGNPLVAFDKLLFVKRFTQETYPDVCLNHMPWVSRPGGDVCILHQPFGQAQRVEDLIKGKLGPGHVHGMDLWWDGSRVVFGYARQKTPQPPAGWNDRASNFQLRRTEEPTRIFEMNIDGSGLRQLTSGQWSDLDPTYLPNGDICFVSERCAFSLQCNEYDKDETSCNLYVMKGDGSGIRRLSVNKDGDYLPHTLDDGTIAYTRWEYHERGFADLQSIWTIRPDGTWADALFKQHLANPWALEDMRSIPSSHKLVAIATGHHTLAAGPVCVIDPAVGMNDSAAIGIVTPGVKSPEGGMSGTPVAQGSVQDAGGLYMTPWPLSEKYFLVSYCYGKQTDPTGYALYLIDVFGNKELIYRDQAISSFTPIPLRPRKRPPILPDLTDPTKDHATCVVSDVTFGVGGVSRSDVKAIRISEPVGWPYDNTHGGHRYERDAKGAGVGWTPTRIIGTVPVEADGSAHFRVPADTAVYFQLLDARGMEIQRMRSFISFQNGEVRACVGCHESRSVIGPGDSLSLASQRAASVPKPPPWGGDRAISFLRDVQSVLDAHCVSCHSGPKAAGGVELVGGLTPGYNRAYESLVTLRRKGTEFVAYSNKYDSAAVLTRPYAFGSHKSRLVTALSDANHAGQVKLGAEDFERLVTWIDANAPYHDGFINKRPAAVPYDLPADRDLTAKLTQIHARRCAGCHKSDEVTRPYWIDLRRPERSLFLVAPLAREAGGSAKCGQGPYKSADDEDYKAVLSLVRSAVQKAWASPRRDVFALTQAVPTTRPAAATRPVAQR
jgi:mono/diheme cytochrome c family protein